MPSKPRKAKVCALDRLLPGRFGGKAGRGLELNIMGLNAPVLPPRTFAGKKEPGSPKSEKNGEHKGGENPFRETIPCRGQKRDCFTTSDTPFCKTV